ncbi:4'-phosphopantetheinyl transferase superfamily protein [Methylobacterium sp. J-048]|uniref:4'-phosphopantetheinyl transferase family protein n=1 Tax=Methylobacterium sp. J-048 TaxID=2836635 RepID=UPI001FBB6102|nr:4'-phosphopantetheinyl transferase superfamily protein [Methylobacterium sp. J-048]MCJ2058062.1 4'-phosphopantetheinyl transferase superfamily protein [Methylobacterium sp. J-048]
MSAAEIWIVDLAPSPEQLDRCGAVLDADERCRAARFLRPADRVRYQASHAALRLILGEALGLAPAEIRLEAGAAGKPELAGSARGALDFNLSHSGGRALVGLVRGAAIGVDVEEIRPIADALRIARSHFAPDEAASLAAQAPEDIEIAFFGLWTRKEAVVKALGTGLSLPLDRFSVSVPPASPRLLRMAQGGALTLADIACGPGYAATVAVRCAAAGIAFRHLEPGWPSRLR